MYSQDYLLKKIEALRKRMYKAAFEKGFTNEETIQLSQELDDLLNIYENKTQNDLELRKIIEEYEKI